MLSPTYHALVTSTSACFESRLKSYSFHMAEANPQDQRAAMDHAEVHYFNRYENRIFVTLNCADRQQLQPSW